MPILMKFKIISWSAGKFWHNLEFTYEWNIQKDISDHWYIEKTTTYSTEKCTFDYL